MKKVGLIFLIVLSNILLSQKRLYDPTIVAQEKRQVFERWGDWRPYPKYVLGIQTNFNYATVWGWLAPARNRQYKNGADIRPLRVGGIETQRLMEVKLQEDEAKKIKVEVDSLYKRNIQDFAYWTPETVEADPLWLLYYKRMLSPLNNFPEKPSYNQWGFKDYETYRVLVETGGLERLQKELDIIKEKYKISRTVAMPRGKRFLMYHECLLRWRKFKSMIAEHREKSTLLLDWKNIIAKPKPSINRQRENDIDIVRNTMNNYKNIEKKYE
ncbi:hypothetical protein [Riemerella anatipestifer]|uniref:Uncharacterized protein n=1 Tax=Riemerella anatipestifer TaxID=34085 RepID=A0AAP6H9A5_RIEAN|nr:hypothetical protein [Riemerella anatipestifer]MCO7354034.1 hypothetical protein [Riemerella anatipestifer]MCU7559135.1 hypothetical protein [Riemerella anatipestifer]MCU7571134.1 hypothetical protein [Riemerella anatipestifer]MCU7597589.1 hypothetical protein [Riemerella anatipestifer]MCW0488332.1 hypothetical protein [Riemerella anatipestifer]